MEPIQNLLENVVDLIDKFKKFINLSKLMKLFRKCTLQIHIGLIFLVLMNAFFQYCGLYVFLEANVLSEHSDFVHICAHSIVVLLAHTFLIWRIKKCINKYDKFIRKCKIFLHNMKFHNTKKRRIHA